MCCGRGGMQRRREPLYWHVGKLFGLLSQVLIVALVVPQYAFEERFGTFKHSIEMLRKRHSMALCSPWKVSALLSRRSCLFSIPPFICSETVALLVLIPSSSSTVLQTLVTWLVCHHYFSSTGTWMIPKWPTSQITMTDCRHVQDDCMTATMSHFWWTVACAWFQYVSIPQSFSVWSTVKPDSSCLEGPSWRSFLAEIHVSISIFEAQGAGELG